MYLDDSLHRLFQTLPPLPFTKLLQAPAANRNATRKAFFKTGQLPQFVYPKVNDLDLESFRTQAKQIRKRLAQDSSSPDLKTLYVRKLDELLKRADLLAAVQTKNDLAVSRLSLELYGLPDLDLANFEQEFSERVARMKDGEVFSHPKTIDAEEFCQLLEQALKHYQVPNWKIKRTPRKRLQCSHNHKSASIILRVPKKLSISRERARRLIAHEIEVHALRRLNGIDSQVHILRRGLAGYSKTEEGLALYHQHRHDHRKHLPGFWDAWASALMYVKGFAAAYTRLYEAQLESRLVKGDDDARKQARATAWTLCVRASRGITHPGNPKIGYFRDHIYRQGYIEVAKAAGKAGDQELLTLLFVGKVGLNDLPLLKSLKLKPARLPDDIGQQLVPRKTQASR